MSPEEMMCARKLYYHTFTISFFTINLKRIDKSLKRLTNQTILEN